MRVTYRNRGNYEYWRDRWDSVSLDGDDGNVEVYPLKYALRVADLAPKGTLLDAGCGAGRVMRYFHARGHDVHGFDFIPEVVDKLKSADPSLKASAGDVTGMTYGDAMFSCVMGFGLYHNLPPELQSRALRETARVMIPGGVLCASFRADNLTTRLSDWLREREQPGGSGGREFHKVNFTAGELRSLMADAGFETIDMQRVENMPVLYKFRLCRHRTHAVFDENRGRREGYRLNWLAGLAQAGFKRLLPNQACNVFVVFARKPIV